MKCDCANCPTHACYTKGVNCTGVPLAQVKGAYTEEELKIMHAAAYVEGTFYSNICRLQETAEFAKASAVHFPTWPPPKMWTVGAPSICLSMTLWARSTMIGSGSCLSENV